MVAYESSPSPTSSSKSSCVPDNHVDDSSPPLVRAIRIETATPIFDDEFPSSSSSSSSLPLPPFASVVEEWPLASPSGDAGAAAAAAGAAATPPPAPAAVLPARNATASGDQDGPNQSSNELMEARRMGAGVASGAFGLLLGGPLLAIVLGLGAAYATKHDEGAAGDAARAVGDLALQAKQRAQEIEDKHRVLDKTKAKATEVWQHPVWKVSQEWLARVSREAKEIEDKHRVSDQTRSSVTETWEKAKEINREHRILERSRSFFIQTFDSTLDYIKRYNLIERGVESFGKTLQSLLQNITYRLEAGESSRTLGPAADLPRRKTNSPSESL